MNATTAINTDTIDSIIRSELEGFLASWRCITDVVNFLRDNAEARTAGFATVTPRKQHGAVRTVLDRLVRQGKAELSFGPGAQFPNVRSYRGASSDGSVAIAKTTGSQPVVAPAPKVPGAHIKLDALLAKISAGLKNLYIVGPAGSGKTTLAGQVAKALDLDFAFLSLSGGVNETHLLGRSIPNLQTGESHYQESDFVRVYEQGGVFLLDEVDAADPNVMVTINAALANGQLSNPIAGRVHKRHAKCIIICAANTFGTGATAQYVGRNPLDAATLDRFVGAMVEVDYDRNIERRIASECEQGSELCRWVWGVRAAASEKGVRRVVGTRMIQAGVALLNAGQPLHQVKAELTVGWSADELRKTGAR